MALKDFKFPSQAIEVAGCGAVTVRGLAPVEVEHLVRMYREEMTAVFDKFVVGGEAAQSNPMQLVGELARTMPGFMAHVIAVAADEEDALEVVKKRMPFGVQLEILDKVVGLTFNLEGGLKKGLENAISQMGGVRGVLEKVSGALAKAA